MISYENLNNIPLGRLVWPRESAYLGVLSSCDSAKGDSFPDEKGQNAQVETSNLITSHGCRPGIPRIDFLAAIKRACQDLRRGAGNLADRL